MKLIAALLLGAAGSAVAQSCPPEVRVSFPNFPIPPLVLGTDTVAANPGQLVTWTRNALRKSGCDSVFIFVRRPPNRQLAELELGAIDILPGFSYNADQSPNMVFPMREGAVNTALRVFTDQTSLYVRASDTGVHWDGTTLAGARTRVGSSTGGSMLQEHARARGWLIEAAPTPASDLNKLLAGRVDVIIESDAVLDSHIGKQPVRKLVPPLEATHRYVAVRKGFQQQYPAFTERFWLNVCLQSRLSYPKLPACQ
jgi:ABC-type amino acid transport substrate-binding protein